MKRVAGIAVAVGMLAGSGNAVESDEPVVLSGVLVTATRTDRPVESAIGRVEIWNARDLDVLNPVMADDILRQIAAGDLQSSNLPGAPVRFSMRGLSPGFGSKRVLVLVDGRRMNDQLQGSADFALLNAIGIERIELLRGPASAVYGSNAMSGVLNIVTRRGTAEPFAILGGRAGTYSTRQYYFNGGAAAGPVDYAISAGFVETGGYIKNRDGSGRPWEAWNLDANMGLLLGENAELRVFTGAYSGEGAGEDTTTAVDRKVDQDYQQLDWRLLVDEASGAELLVRAWRSARDDRRRMLQGTERYDQESWNGEILQTLRLGRLQRLTAGAEMRRESVDAQQAAADFDESTNLRAVYVQDEITLTERMELVAGARYDYDDDFGGEWSPRAAVVYTLNDNAEVYASYNRAHRAPAISDRYVDTVFWGMRFAGNPDLTPETLDAYEVGLRLRPSDNLKTELTVFHYELDDTFDYVLQADGTFRNLNVTGMETKGVECSLQWRLGKSLSVMAEYTFTDGEYTKNPQDPAIEGNRPAYLSRNKATARAVWSGISGQSHSFGVRYAGSRYGDARNSTDNRMDDYVVYDWQSRVPVFRTPATLTLSVDNLFNTDYETYPGIRQPGTAVLAGLEIAL